MTELTFVGTEQTVLSGANVPFNTAIHRGCPERWRAGSSTITLTKAGRYLITASANVAIPADGTATTPINIALTENGETLVGTVMASTPGVVSRFNNVSAQTYVDVYPCCCETIALENVGAEAILINNQNLTAILVK